MRFLFGSLSGGGSLGGFDYHGNFLVNRVSVGGRSRFRGIHDFFDDGDLGILVLLFTLTSHSTVHDKAQDKEHPEEDSNSTAKDEGDDSTFPPAQIHEGTVDAINEGSFTAVVLFPVVPVVVWADGMWDLGMFAMVVMVMLRRIGNADLEISFLADRYKSLGSADER